MVNVFKNTLPEIQKAVEEEYTRINLKNSSYKDWFELFGSLFSGYATTRYNIDPKFVFRARINYDFIKNKKVDLFSNVSELGAPPASEVSKIGRCNDKNESIFYCSHDPMTTLFEINPSFNQEFSVIKYRVIREFQELNAIGPEFLATLNMNLPNIFKPHYLFKGTSINYIKKLQYIDSVLLREFKRIVTEESTFYYNITLGITKFYLNDNSVLEPIIKAATPSCGLIYPSVALNNSGINFAVTPEIASECLQPLYVQKYVILMKNNNEYYIQQTHFANNINKEGNLEWVKCFVEPKYVNDLV
jgi:hypothetical protein